MENNIATQIVGSNIKRLRKERGWSQTELGNRIGVGLKTIARYETAVSAPSFHSLDSLAEAFGVSLSTLFEEHDKDEVNEEDLFTLACQLMRKELFMCCDNITTEVYRLRKRGFIEDK